MTAAFAPSLIYCWTSASVTFDFPSVCARAPLAARRAAACRSSDVPALLMALSIAFCTEFVAAFSINFCTSTAETFSPKLL